MLNINEQEIAQKIQKAFSETLQVEVSLETILENLKTRKKLGVTNEYTDDFEIDSKKYLIRINGTQWPPYDRTTETHALNILRKNGVETYVIINQPDFQMCKAPEKEKSLENYLSKNNEDDINKALSLTVNEIVKYQKLQSPNIDYPISKMLEDALRPLDILLADFPEILKSIKYFGEICKKIIALGKNFNWSFSHNDFTPDSIFIDFTNSKVAIVDWEYAAKAYWSNDLSMLGRFLTPQQFEFLTNQYLQTISPDSTDFINAKFQKDALIFNRFLLKFLYEVAWKIKPRNANQFVQKIAEMQDEANNFIKNLDNYLKINTLVSELPSLPKSADTKNFPSLSKEQEKASAYKPIFQPIDYTKRIWMPEQERILLNALLDMKMSDLAKKLEIETNINSRYANKASLMGWQLFLYTDEKHQALCLAVLQVENSEQANKLIHLIQASGANLTAKLGQSDEKNCVIISFPHGANTFEDLSKELDRMESYQAKPNVNMLTKE